MLTLEEVRREWEPAIPLELENPQDLVLFPQDDVPVLPDVAALFPKLNEHKILRFKTGREDSSQPLTVGVLFSGGPAAGGHNVVAGLYRALQKCHPDSTLIGLLGGPSGLIEGKSRILTAHEVLQERNQGGFDLLGTGRTKIEKPEQFAGCLKTIQDLKLDGVVIIGGDDSNTNAAYLANYLKENNCSTTVVGVPKTIDGDLQNLFIEISFGFDSASKTYSELVGNVCKDAKSQDKYYFFIKLMGRTASHLVLETALQTHPNLILIGEELARDRCTLKQVVQNIAKAIILREKEGLHHGVILIPEGIIEFIEDVKNLVSALTINPDPLALSGVSKEVWGLLPQETQAQLLLDRDPHGNVQVSKIETERLLIKLVADELKRHPEYKGSFNPQPLFFGYEGRSCFPTAFDSCYCYALGQVAALLIQEKASGYMALIHNLARPVPEWIPAAAPLVAMMECIEKKGIKKAVIRKGLVDLQGAPYTAWKKMEEECLKKDDYLSAGPIQFFGEEEIVTRPPMTLIS